ncbi:MAG TPA: PAS domain S-box protein [Methanospirillum sp.]|nr:PAS domain S-box protein [Methanospirillum sp.]
MSSPPLRVLYVDDEEALLDIARLFLERSGGFKVEIISSAQAALDILQKSRFDAIISDYLMPVMNGIELLKAVREDPRIRDIPFILFTGRGREEVVIEAINSGVDFYLQKGGDPKSQFAELKHKVQQAVKRKRSEQAALENYALLSLAEGITGIGSWTVNLNPRKGTYSDGLFSIFRIPRIENPSFAYFNDVMHPDDRSRIESLQNQLIQEELDYYEADFRIICPDGSERYIHSITRSITNLDGSVRLNGTVQDVTDFRAITDALRISEYKYRRLHESMMDGFVLVSMDGRIREWNDSFEQMLGYAPDQLARMKYQDFTPEKWHDFEEKIITEIVKNGFSGVYEKENQRADGTTFPVEIRAFLLKDSEDGNEGMWAIVRDITTRKAAEEHLITSAREWQATFDTISDAVWILDKESRIIRCNAATETLFGLSGDEILGRHCFEVVHNSSEAIEECPFQCTMQSGSRGALELQKGDRWWQITLDPILNEQGEKTGAVHIIRDITARKKGEEDLIETSREWHQIFDSIGSPALIMDGTHTIIHGNQAVLALTGLLPEELQGMKCFEIFHHPGCTHSPPGCPYSKMLASGTFETMMMEMEAFGGDYLVSCSPLSAKNGQITKVIHIATDISDRRRKMQALEESEKRYRSIIEHAPWGMHQYRLEPDGRLIFEGSNPAGDQILGLSTANEIGKPIEEAFPGLVGTEIPAAYTQVAQSGEVWRTEQFVYHEGRIAGAFEVIAFQVSQGHMVASFMDITTKRRDADERKREEQGL